MKHSASDWAIIISRITFRASFLTPPAAGHVDPVNPPKVFPPPSSSFPQSGSGLFQATFLPCSAAARSHHSSAVHVSGGLLKSSWQQMPGQGSLWLSCQACLSHVTLPPSASPMQGCHSLSTCVSSAWRPQKVLHGFSSDGWYQGTKQWCS